MSAAGVIRTASGLAVPVLILLLIVYALIKKVNVYKAFVEGAAEALPQLIKLMPSLAAMLAAINLLRASGALDTAVSAAEPLLKGMGVSKELAPLIVLRPFSGSASLALMRDVIINCGADSKTGRAAAVIMGSTETIFYTLTVYFGAAGVTKTRHAMPAALIAGAVGTAAGLIFTEIM